MKKLLFILKKTQSSGGDSSHSSRSGLFNSAKFIVEMLNDSGVKAHIVEVTDNNDIDREVTRFRPTDVIIEALWVVPEKFDILKELHPRVNWIVRLHSDIPFLANEGVAMQWIFGYLKRGVKVAPNSPKVVRELRNITQLKYGIPYLPNFYPVREPHSRATSDIFRIGCFGAIRPMKNQLIQAVAAVEFARQNDLRMEFWINASRTEQGGDNVLRNLRSIFANIEYDLVEVPWLERPEFLKIISHMNLAMCVSMSETFCITAADAVSAGTPLVCSDEIPWASALSVSPETDARKIVERMNFVMTIPSIVNFLNRRNLKNYSAVSRNIWLQRFGS